ncbi:MAG: T9SS type A sorting domain-containing protein [Ferruginibacter sp.]
MIKPLLFGLLLFSVPTISQNLQTHVTPGTLNIGGGSATITPNFIMDWSIGESTAIETWNGENSFANSIIGIHWNVTSGILQPFDKTHIIFNYLAATWTDQEIRFYPVPTPNTVFIDFRSAIAGKVSIQLLTQEGKLLGTKEFSQTGGLSTQSWNLSNRTSGIYLFRILLTSDKGILLKQGTFKVEKNK